MANENTPLNFPKRIAEYYNKLYWLTIKLHNTAASIGFIKKALYAHVTPKFAQIKGQFVNAERIISLKAASIVAQIVSFYQLMQFSPCGTNCI